MIEPISLLTNKKNNRGLRRDPCGTPEKKCRTRTLEGKVLGNQQTINKKSE